VFVLISAVVIAIDQISKALVARFMVEGSSIEILGDLFRLSYVRNPGIAFGIQFVESRAFHVVFSAVALIVVVLMIKDVWGAGSPLTYPLSLIFGGALGNLIDRVRLGEVTDFLDFGIAGYRWPVFNVADAAVTIGVLLAAFSYMLKGKTHGDGKEGEPQDNQGA